MNTILLASQFLGEKDTTSHVYLEGTELQKDGVVVVPLQDGDIWKATGTWNDAFIDDPMVNYVTCGTKSNKIATRIITSAGLALWIRTKRSLTVNHGEALLVSTPPEDTRHPIHRRLDGTFSEFLRLFGRVGSSERKKRVKEADTKIKLALQEVIGDHAKNMWLIDLLCTNPLCQGNGYGSALLSEIKARLDLAQQSAWLTSSNIANESFYNFHGFFSVADIYLGDDNPEWDRKPVKIQIMVRKPTPRSVV